MAGRLGARRSTTRYCVARESGRRLVPQGLVYVTRFWAARLRCEECPNGTMSSSRLVGCAAGAFVALWPW